MWSLSTAKRAIIIAGCLAAAYLQFSTSPATIAFARSLGANGLDIGILGALPTGMLFMQLLAAISAHYVNHRKPLWFWVAILQRLVLLPAALGPWLWPDLPPALWVTLLLSATATNHAMMHFTTPLWLSWMGDYLPHRGLSRYWGIRELCMQSTAAAALLATALVFLRSGLDMRAAFSLIIGVGAICGVCDILLFIKVEEPPLTPVGDPHILRSLMGPFRDHAFRCFIVFSCFFNLAAMIGAPFISIFLLDYVGMDLFRILLLWTFSWVGGAMFSHKLGYLVERFGQRPMLILCVAFKSINMIGLLAAPQNDPTTAFYWLIPVFMFDSMLNSGILIANNSFMIKHSPRDQRAMFIAAGNAFAGMVGGTASVVSGYWLRSMAEWSCVWSGKLIVGYHVLFAISLGLRFVAAVLAQMLREPSASPTPEVLNQIAARTYVSLLRAPRFLQRRGRRPAAVLVGERDNSA